MNFQVQGNDTANVLGHYPQCIVHREGSTKFKATVLTKLVIISGSPCKWISLRLETKNDKLHKATRVSHRDTKACHMAIEVEPRVLCMMVFYCIFQCLWSSYHKGQVMMKVHVMTYDYKDWVIGYNGWAAWLQRPSNEF